MIVKPWTQIRSRNTARVGSATTIDDDARCDGCGGREREDDGEDVVVYPPSFGFTMVTTMRVASGGVGTRTVGARGTTGRRSTTTVTTRTTTTTTMRTYASSGLDASSVKNEAGKKLEMKTEKTSVATSGTKTSRPGLNRRFADERSLETPVVASKIREFWYPVMFESKFDVENEEFEVCLLDEQWVVSKVAEGEYRCVSKKSADKELATGTRDGLVMVWPGTCAPSEELPSHFAPPEGYIVHAELIIDDVPVEHGLLMENLLDLAHAPFTHTGTFAKGWGVPNMVKFASSKMRKEGDGWHDMGNFLANGRSEGSWKPYPIDMKFLAPCMVDSHIGLSQAGAVGKGAQFTEGVTALECEKHLHQLHVCLPSTPGRTRLLYRMSLDFASWAQFIPGIEYVWTEMANQVLGEDLRLVVGQQDRMQRGGRVWANPVAYDKLGLHYRRWRNVMEGRDVDECSVAE